MAMSADPISMNDLQEITAQLMEEDFEQGDLASAPYMEQARTLEQITDVLMNGAGELDEIAESALPEGLLGSVDSLVSESMILAAGSFETGAATDGDFPSVSFAECAKDAGCNRLLAELGANLLILVLGSSRASRVCPPLVLCLHDTGWDNVGLAS